MTRFIIIFLILIGISTVSYARALTSIQLDGKSYNLVIFSNDEHDYAVKLFNDNLKAAKKPERIKVCSFIIDMPAGTGKGNHSYGGYCTAQEDGPPYKLMVCGDYLRGTSQTKLIENVRFPKDGINDLARLLQKIVLVVNGR